VPTGTTKGPCDIYAEDGGPCVGAHSTVRALFAEYDGPLYQVRKGDSVMDIRTVGPGGMAKAADQESFCGVEACTISVIYDQSGWKNDLTKAPPGMASPKAGIEAKAKGIPITIGGHQLYGVHIVPGGGYRNNDACGTATGDKPETEYMVVSGNFSNTGCCFDYGNMERNSRDNGEGTMEAVYFGSCIVWGRGADPGPWVMGDLENGLWAGDSSPYQNNKPVIFDSQSGAFTFVTGLVKGESASKDWPSGHWAIKVGDAQRGTLVKPFDGKRPSARYTPMKKEGAIGMGTGGDNSSIAQGNFFEGVMTATYSSDAADEAVQANIVAFYGQ